MVKILILQIAGILLAESFQITVLTAMFLLSVFLLLLFIFARNRWILPLIIIFAMMTKWASVQPPSHGISGEEIPLTGVAEWVKASKTGTRLKITAVGVEPFSFIFTDRTDRSILPGDTLDVRGILVSPDPLRNPGQFDYREYLRQKGISFILTKGEIDRISEGRWSFRRQFYKIQRRVRMIINTYVDQPFSGVMTGLILGDRSGIDDELKNRFQEIGVIHILAVSGLHVGYIFMILSFMTSGLNIRGKAQFCIITSGLVFYMGLTGFTTSVVRAGLMMIMYSWGKMREKSISGWNIISATAVIILSASPLQLFSPGFLLSFGAVWGILFTYPRLQQIDSRFPRWGNIRKTKIIRFVTNLVMVTIGAQIGTFIPVAMYFKFFPVWGFLSNLLIVFLAGAAVITGILTIIFSFIYSGPASLFGEAAWSVLWLINGISKQISYLPFKRLPLGGLSVFTTVVIFILLAFWIWSLGAGRIGKVLAATLLFLNLQVWSAVLSEAVVKITFLDVGQGDSCVIQDGHQTILIDTGYGGFGRDMGQSVILPFLAHEGITDIDLLILSHPHADHIGGATSVIKSLPVKVLWNTFTDYKSQLYMSIMDLCNQKHIPVNHVRPGEVYQLGRITLTNLYPAKKISQSMHNVNNSSIVLRLDHDENSVLFVGDLESAGESWVLKTDVVNHMDMIKIGHHGSITSSTEPFCRRVGAKYGIISSGKDNKFGHPSDLVIHRWESHGTKIFRTDHSGAVMALSKGNTLRVSTMLKSGK